ncbi:hypothetical protein [Micromonospora sp. URMC 103]
MLLRRVEEEAIVAWPREQVTAVLDQAIRLALRRDDPPRDA